MFRFYNLTMEHNDTKWHHNQLCDLWMKLSCIWNILHGSDLRWKGVTSSSDTDNLPKIVSLHEFSCHSKPSRPFPTYGTVDIFTLSLAVSLYQILRPEAAIIGALITHNISDSSIQHLSVGSGQYTNLTGPWGCMRKVCYWYHYQSCVVAETKTEFVNFLTVLSDLVCLWPTVGTRNGTLEHTNICIITDCREYSATSGHA